MDGNLKSAVESGSDCRGVAQPGSAPALGAGGPEFKSRRPDQNISRVFLSLLKAPFTPTPTCGILADRRSEFTSRLVCESSLHDEFAKTSGGRSAIQKLLNGRKLSAQFGKYGENSGDPEHFSVRPYCLVLGDAAGAITRILFVVSVPFGSFSVVK